jgi:hypothetical protein
MQYLLEISRCNVAAFCMELKGLNSGIDCYHLIQKLLSSRLLYKNVTIRMHKSYNLPVVLYRCETLSLTLRKEPGLRVFVNRVLRRTFGPKSSEVTGNWRKLYHELYKCN